MTWGRYRVCLDPDTTCVVIDFETTGLSDHRHEIIEIGALRLIPGRDGAPFFHRLVKPTRRVPPKIIALTGMTNERLASEGVECGDAIRDLASFIGNHPVVSYNAPFDLGFLNRACDKHGVNIMKRGGHSCALRLARRVWPGLSSYRLSDVARFIGLPLDGEHTALSDAMRAARVYRIASHDHRRERV